MNIENTARAQERGHNSLNVAKPYSQATRSVKCACIYLAHGNVNLRMGHGNETNSTCSYNNCLECTTAGAVPSLQGAAKQLNILKKELNLNSVFLASDGSEQGM